MAPALTKLTKDGPGIHLSSTALNSSNMEAEGAMLSGELDPQVKLMDDSFSQKVWLNLSSMPFGESCCPKSLLEFPDSLLAPLLQASTGQYKTVLLSNPGSLLSLLSPNKNLEDSQAAAYPGAQDMYFVPFPEHNSLDLALQPQHSVPNGSDVPRSPPHCQGETMFQYGSASLPTPPTARRGGGVCEGRGPAQVWVARAPDQTVIAAEVQGALRELTQWHVSRQAALLGRAGRIQGRLQALLVEHSSRHYSLQLDALKAKLGWAGGTEFLSPPAETKPGPPLVHGKIPTSDSKTRCHPLPNTSPPSTSIELQEFVRQAQAVMLGVQQVIDSDVTEISSDEEPQPKEQWGNLSVPMAGCEGRWQQERAEVGSRWTWLQLRVAELEGRILQLRDLHQQISSLKGGVVLGESKPLTDRQIQQTLLTETAGLSFAAGGGGDTENEPSSPERLLRNIERQSAQLTQIVNSLMPHLNLSPSSSPVSKKPCRWKELTKRGFSSGLRGEDVFIHRGLKRRRVCRRRHLQADASCVSARTCPLVTYHKPRLFTMNTTIAHGQRDLDVSSCSSSSSCPTFESCDPLALCSDPVCSGYAPASGRNHSRPHPALSLSSDPRLAQHLQTALLREDWVQRPLLLRTEPSSLVHWDRRLSSTPLLSGSHGHKHRRTRRRAGVSSLSPAWTPLGRAYRGGRKRGHTHRMMEDEDFRCELSSPENSSDEALMEIYTPQTSHTCKPQGPIRRRQGENIYNIDNIVIPMSLAVATKLEKLQYKHIITPSWRVVDAPPLEEREEEKEEVELLCDEAFSMRHLGCEQREKLRWVSWGKSRRHRHATRSLDTSDGAGSLSWDHSVRSHVTPPLDWSCTQLETDAEGGAREAFVPQATWEQRVFPLGEDEEEALRCDEEEQTEAASRWSERKRTGAEWSSTDDTSSSSVPSHLSSLSTPPPTGH